ncbi:MAG: hypothetical protein GY953_44340, partial [bacterium]|nr:hypothetical protein [bacterium]
MVPNVATEVLARTLSAPIYQPALLPGRDPRPDPHYGIAPIPELPAGGSALVVWDDGSCPTPLDNTAPEKHNDPHGVVRAQASARLQKAEFLKPGGQIVDVCGPIDPEVGALKVEKMDGSMLGAIINFSCHNNAGGIAGISADFGGYAMEVIERVEGNGSVALFTPGACGNIGAGGEIRGAVKMGKVLGAEALKTLVRTSTTQDVKLAAVRREIDLPLREFELQIDEILKIWPSGEDVFREEMDRLKESKADHVSTYIQALVIGDTAFVSVPGELFVELGLEIKEKSPFK